MRIIIGKGMEKTFLDWMKKLRRNNSTRQNVPINQSLQLKLLPLSHAEITPHP